MLIALLLTGAIWLYDIYFGRPQRKPGDKEPLLVEYSRSFFPVILAVFMLRSFLVEPFKIPSGSMMPTLLVGDFILVNKYTYGIRLPVANVKVLDVNQPKRGEVMVFRYPKDTSLDYIKRVVGTPGDRIVYKNKHLFVNGEPVPMTRNGEYEYTKAGLNHVVTQLNEEILNGHKHAVLLQPESEPVRVGDVDNAYPKRENCVYNEEGFSCTVPDGMYFMMGDNRDDSNDSRYWGFVPDRNIVGKAFFVWWNFGDFKRIGTVIN